MVISEENSYCFIAVPKTGTTSITAQLRKDSTSQRGQVVVDGVAVPIGEHITAQGLIDIIGRDRWSRLYSFGFVRNPWDRVVSAYFYYRNGRAAETVLKGKYKKLKQSKTKLKTVLQVLLANLLPFSIWVYFYRARPYADFLTDKTGDIVVSDVFSFEDIEGGFNNACKKLGLEGLELKKLNVTKHEKYQKYYTKTSQLIVASRFKQDIELFGYKFDA